MPVWWPEMPKPPKWSTGLKGAPDFIYLSACIQRMMGNDEEQGSVQDAMMTVSNHAGIKLWLPGDLNGHCCGQAFSSKGYFEAAQIRQRALLDALWHWTEEGRIPVVCDFTSCTYTIMAAGKGLEKTYQDKWKAITFMDSVQYLNQVVLPKLSNIQKKGSVVLHPGCAVTKLQLISDMKELASALSRSVVIPKDAGCCGMAGDRGFLFPELTRGATGDELKEAVSLDADGYYASAKTCEMALTHFGGKPYRHIVYLVKEACGHGNAGQ
jgi:D-lactate dehydrogenase